MYLESADGDTYPFEATVVINFDERQANLCKIPDDLLDRIHFLAMPSRFCDAEVSRWRHCRI